MERMTKKIDYGYINVPNNSKFIEPLEKLGQLEDIEEELGIELITLFKAFKNNYIYVKDKCTIITSFNYYLTRIRGTYCLWCEDYDLCIHIKIKDYGKTWALTKEELE